MKFYKIVSDKIVNTNNVEYVTSSYVSTEVASQISSASATTGGTAGKLVKTNSSGKVDASFLPSISINEFIGSFGTWEEAYAACVTDNPPLHYENGDVLVIKEGWLLSGFSNTAANGTYSYVVDENSVRYVNSNGWTLSYYDSTGPYGVDKWLLSDDQTLDVSEVDAAGNVTSLTFTSGGTTLGTGVKQPLYSVSYICVNKKSSVSSVSDFKNQFVPINENQGSLTLDSFIQGSNVNLNKNPTNNTVTISVSLATSNAAGVVKPDGTTITVDANGVMSATVQSPTWSELPLALSATTDGWSRTTSGTNYVYSKSTPNEVMIRTSTGEIIYPSELVIANGSTSFTLPTDAGEISAGSFIYRSITGLSTT